VLRCQLFESCHSFCFRRVLSYLNLFLLAIAPCLQNCRSYFSCIDFIHVLLLHKELQQECQALLEMETLIAQVYGVLLNVRINRLAVLWDNKIQMMLLNCIVWMEIIEISINNK
jgi:hypothetical protein